MYVLIPLYEVSNLAKAVYEINKGCVKEYIVNEKLQTNHQIQPYTY